MGVNKSVESYKKGGIQELKLEPETYFIWVFGEYSRYESTVEEWGPH